MKAEPVEIGAEPRLLAGDAKIRHQGEAEPAADRRAMHRADDRLPGAEQADRLLVQVPPGGAAGPLGDGAGIHPLREIGAGAERAALGGEHDRPDVGVGIEPLEGVADLGNQRAIKEIVRRPPHLDGSDKPVAADADFAIGGLRHIFAPTGRSFATPYPDLI